MGDGLSNGSGTPPAGDPSVSPGQAPTSTPPAGHEGNEPHTPPSTQSTDVHDLLRQIKDLRKENSQIRDKLSSQAAAAAAAEEAKLKEQGEYKKLAEQHEVKLRELEPLATAYGKLQEQLSEQISADIKDWPATVKALDPGKSAPIEERLAWKAKAAAIVAQLSGTPNNANGNPPAPGNPPGPPPAGPLHVEQANVAELRSRMRQSGKYGF